MIDDLNVPAQLIEVPKPARKRNWFAVIQIAAFLLWLGSSVLNIQMIHQNELLAAKWEALIAREKVQPADLSQYDHIHMPASGKCPEGFDLSPRLFERDGRAIAGCTRTGTDPSRGAVDRIGPGESFRLLIPIEPPRRPDSPSVRQ